MRQPLLQPELPGLIVLDEPELGLHPAAIVVLAGMMSAAASRTQVIAATQSVPLIDQFTPEQVWAVEREGGQSVFKKLSLEDMSAWSAARHGPRRTERVGDLPSHVQTAALDRRALR